MTRAEAIALEEFRRAHVPLYNDQKLKLGVFGINCSYGLNISHAPTTYKVTWEHTSEIVKRADAMGFELALPVARWRGFGGTTDFNGKSFETYTWAAGLAQATRNIMVAATSHVPTVHPIVAAKQAATIDHISNGRFALNLVMGWFTPEMEMFQGTQRAHDDRYRYGAEWLTVVKRLWTDEAPFDFESADFHIKQAQAHPKPIQKPYPVLINAGHSPAARISPPARSTSASWASTASNRSGPWPRGSARRPARTISATSVSAPRLSSSAARPRPRRIRSIAASSSRATGSPRTIS